MLAYTALSLYLPGFSIMKVKGFHQSDYGQYLPQRINDTPKSVKFYVEFKL